jgi:hypothetical protein
MHGERFRCLERAQRNDSRGSDGHRGRRYFIVALFPSMPKGYIVD